jgi:hypothetical protein
MLYDNNGDQSAARSFALPRIATSSRGEIAIPLLGILVDVPYQSVRDPFPGDLRIPWQSLLHLQRLQGKRH